jgi:hypothetical protein
MRFRKWHAVLVIVLVAAVVLFLSSSVDAQCSMCRASLTSSTDGRFIKNFNIAVLVLLIPPVSIFCSIFIILRKHRGDG